MTITQRARAIPKPGFGTQGKGAAAAPQDVAAAPGNQAADADSDAEIDDMLVVECEIVPAAAERGAFDDVLAMNQMSATGETEPADDTPGAPPSAPVEVFRNVAPVVVEGRVLAPGSAASTQQTLTAGQAGGKIQVQFGVGGKQNNQVPGQAAQQNQALAQSPRQIYVEATRGQIESTLAALQQRSHDFPSLRVEPASQAPTQQSLAHYDRTRQLGDDKSQLAKGKSRASMKAGGDVTQAPANAGELDGKAGTAEADIKEAVDKKAPANALADDGQSADRKGDSSAAQNESAKRSADKTVDTAQLSAAGEQQKPQDGVNYAVTQPQAMRGQLRQSVAKQGATPQAAALQFQNGASTSRCGCCSCCEWPATRGKMPQGSRPQDRLPPSRHKMGRRRLPRRKRFRRPESSLRLQRLRRLPRRTRNNFVAGISFARRRPAADSLSTNSPQRLSAPWHAAAERKTPWFPVAWALLARHGSRRGLLSPGSPTATC